MRRCCAAPHRSAVLSRYTWGFLAVALLPVLLAAAPSPSPEPPSTLSRAQALEDLGWLRRSLEYVYPSLCKYDDKATVDARFEGVAAGRGKLYVLMNGGTFSSAADAIADIHRTTDAAFIGEESGGLYEGPTGGDTIVVQLPHSEIRVRISPNIQLGYMYRKHPVGRGVMPTHPTRYSIEDVVAGRDLEMERATALVREERQRNPSR